MDVDRPGHKSVTEGISEEDFLHAGDLGVLKFGVYPARVGTVVLIVADRRGLTEALVDGRIVLCWQHEPEFDFRKGTAFFQIDCVYALVDGVMVVLWAHEIRKW